mmetsp:Transcript_83575/g.223668  ORF Transcript_83575/g.223668 Transcript_83575/m.223668 type:complete len:82 (+) Transcript_83575:33-278(+)
MFAILVHASGSPPKGLEASSPDLAQMLSMVCPHDYTHPCKQALLENGKAKISNTVRMYNKLMCGKSICDQTTEATVDKMIK